MLNLCNVHLNESNSISKGKRFKYWYIDATYHYATFKTTTADPRLGLPEEVAGKTVAKSFKELSNHFQGTSNNEGDNILTQLREFN